MGFRLEIDGQFWEITQYSVTEASTPLSAADETGQVGSFSASVKKVDEEAYVGSPQLPFSKYPILTKGKPFYITDTRKGFTLGTITDVTLSDSGIFNVSGTTRLGELNVFNIQAGPFTGRLEDAFRYYCGLANIDTDIFVDPEISDRSVSFPGWFGDLWIHFKQMAAAIDCDIALVSGVILLRPIRRREATKGRDIDHSLNVTGQMAQSIEIYCYYNEPIVNEPVYPPGGWTEEVVVYTVSAGETIEEVLELSASLSSIEQPVMKEFVGRFDVSQSVYTIVGDDGFPIVPAQWEAQGGSLSVEINDDTTSLTLKVTAPSGIAGKDGKELHSYSIGLASDTGTSSNYSTLRLKGTGVAFNKELHTLPTGLTPQQTGTEVGLTIDNPFISDLNTMYRAGTRAANQFTGRNLAFSGNVIAINRLGDSGQATYPSYDDVRVIQFGKTYAQVKASFSGFSYAQVKAFYFELVKDDFENQVFGNVSGARVWSEKYRRYFRIREATLNPGPISFTAEDDTTYADARKVYYGLSWAEEREIFAGLSYHDRFLLGLHMPYILEPPESGTPFPALFNFPSEDFYPGEGL